MIEALEKALYQALTGDSSLTDLLSGTAAVYNQIAPPDAKLPFVVFDVDYRQLNDTPRLAVDCFITIKGATTEGAQSAGSISDAITNVMESPLSVSGYVNYCQFRTRAFEYVEVVPSARPVWYAGGEFVVRLEEE